MNLFDCDIDTLLSATGLPQNATEDGDGYYTLKFCVRTELRIPITPDDKFRCKRIPEGVLITVCFVDSDSWITVGHVPLEDWPVPAAATCVLSCIIPDPIRPQMRVKWAK